MLRLFLVLSTWQPTTRLILELNACSPGDSEHWFKNRNFGLKHEDDGDLVQQPEVATQCGMTKITAGSMVSRPRLLVHQLYCASPPLLSLPKRISLKFTGLPSL